MDFIFGNKRKEIYRANIHAKHILMCDYIYDVSKFDSSKSDRYQLVIIDLVSRDIPLFSTSDG